MPAMHMHSLSNTGILKLFTISYHLGTPYCQRVPLLPEQLIWSQVCLFIRIIYIKITVKTTTKFNEIIVFVSFHKWVDSWRKFANSLYQVLMLQNNRNSSYTFGQVSHSDIVMWPTCLRRGSTRKFFVTRDQQLGNKATSTNVIKCNVFPVTEYVWTTDLLLRAVFSYSS